MSEHPIPAVGDEFDGNPIIETAVRAVWAFAPGAEHTITRDQAADVLKWWQHHHELSEREIAAILRRFPIALEDTGGWISGPMRGPSDEPR
jgi:hypothetical protein